MKNILIVLIFCLLSSTALNAQVILNEYNAVGSSRFLDGDLFTDSDKADTVFGRIVGNGGNWFELLVIGDGTSSTVDMRGWALSWTEDEEVDPVNSPGVTAAGTISLTNDSAWAAIEVGTIITFIETPDAGGAAINTATDLSFDGTAGDWHLNVCTTQEQATGQLLTTTTNDGLAGEFSVGNDDWQLTILDNFGTVVSGPTGEGDGNLTGVSSREVGKLEGLVAPDSTLADWLAIDLATAPYNDGTSSSFGEANIFSAGSMTQDLSALREPASTCGDVNQDGVIDFGDIPAFIAVLQSGVFNAQADCNQDSNVDFADIPFFIDILAGN